ncbi:MAG: alpha/beta hydrolase [Candidatus Pacebacteria bacterium]|nr:alpha/beta hydrolase [Candidatus Paceibacterota bacterium]
MEKIIIQNRKGLKMAVAVDEIKNQKGLVFLMHGHLGFKEHPLLTETAKIFKEYNFTIVLFDATNSLGESEGKMEGGTITSYYEDLEDIINWSKLQSFYQKSFFLSGHSLGGYCVANYAVNNNLKGVILFCPLVSGKLYQETNNIKDILEDWKASGVRVWESHSSPGIIKKAGYDFIKDGEKHDLLKTADKIKCPVLIIGGDKDDVIPIEHQKMLFDKIKSKKEFHIIKDGDHNLSDKENSTEFHDIINRWIIANY